MEKLEAERRMLALANRHVAEGRRRIEAQAQIVAELQAAGLESFRMADALLTTMRACLDSMLTHRRVLEDEVERLEEVRATLAEGDLR
ncbi:hypothetical protein [Paraburkholderia diazotrophica]|uniref:hypothetical protein n=1 Tax=Paraburkholderia diazotrophica TaxID=667676 RepID=UPI00316C13CA